MVTFKFFFSGHIQEMKINLKLASAFKPIQNEGIQCVHT